VRRADNLAGPVPGGLRLATAIVAVALAYHFSFATLASNWRYDTPLADLVLVPPIAAALAIAALRRHPFVVSLRLGRFDYLFAALLIGIALALVAIGPTLWSKYFWAMRIDLLTVPLFAAAVVVLLFGSRAVIPLGFPVLFLLLVWPLPYDALLEHALSSFTQSTAGAVERLAVLTHVASPIAGSDGSRYLLEQGGESIVVSVASACSGVNALVGFGVIGIAAMWLVRGPVMRRLAWLALGAGLVWLMNVGRIVVVLFTAQRFGEHAAFDLLHPVAGIVALNLGFLLLVRLLPLFGLHRRHFDEHDLELVDSPLARTAAPAQQATPGRFAVRLVVVATATVSLALANGQLGRAAKGLDETGRPAVVAFIDRPAAGAGWTLRRVERIRWAAPYYGRHSSWVRYRLRPTGAVARRGAFTVWTDAVLSPDLGALDAFSLAHCYSFHHFDVRTSLRVDLGDGVTGQVFVYATSEGVWHAVAWEWPVLRRDHVQHERLVLLASTTTRPGPPPAGEPDWLRQRILRYLNTNARKDDPNPQLSRALIALAAQMVSSRVKT
jgi:exosortase/archaeosortase family protein